MNPSQLAERIAEELGSTGSGRGAPGPTRPARVADHELVRPIGAGSYGEVWLARSVTGQWRAVKLVARARFESERPYEREYRGVVQFEPISRSHPALVQVLHVGRDDAAGAFYYVMELADPEQPLDATDGARLAIPGAAGSGGATLQPSPGNLPGTSAGRPPHPTWQPATTDAAADLEAVLANYRPRTLRSDLNGLGRLPVAEVLALGVQLSGALRHLHQHGLVHRDVKPSNVIFVRGQPKLADLGLVATTNEARSFVGTEGFIPPEGPGTVQADLFAFGRLLYEAATGKDRCEFPEVPPDLDSWPDREAFLELNEILTRLCAPELSRRCPNAAAAAGDLNLLLAGRSVRKAYGVERRLRRATRISALALGAAALAFGIVWFQEVRQRRAEARATAERTLRQRAQAAEHTSRQQLYTALLEQARATVRSGELGQRVRALDAVRRAAAIRNTPELRREAVAALALPDLRFERELACSSRFTTRQLDPAFERVAVCEGRGPVEIRAVADDRRLATLPATTNLMCYNAMWSNDGRFLTVKRDHDGYGYREEIEVWDLSDLPRLALHVSDARRNVRALHPQQPRLVTSDAQGRIVTWDLERGAELARRALSSTPVEWLVFAPDGARFAAIHPQEAGSLISIYETASDRLLASRLIRAGVMTIAWHPQGRWLAVPDLRGSVRLLDPETAEDRTLGRHRAEAVTATFDASGNYLFTGGWERSLICWDLRTMQRSFAIELDGYHLHVRADGRQCAILTPQGVQLLRLEQPLPRQFSEDLGSRLRFAAFSPDGQWLAAAADERLGVWDLTREGPGALADEAAEASPSWAPEGRELFASRRDDDCFRWQVIPAAGGGNAPTLERAALPRPPGFTWLSVASNLVAWTSTNGSQIVRRPGLLPAARDWSPTAPGMNGISPDGRWLGIYRGYTATLHVYRLPGFDLAARLNCMASIGGFQFSPAINALAVASRGQVEFWDTRTWERTRVLTNVAGIPHVGVLAQPDGGGWWLAPEQRFAGFYAPGSLELRLPLPSTMAPLAVSADGRQLAVSVEARRLQVWDLHRVRSQLRELGLDWSDDVR